jgi:thiamine pyrophosphokinase
MPSPQQGRVFFMTNNKNKVILFVNGDLPAGERILTQITPDDTLIAVDGGLSHMVRLGLTPDLIIGDLDSVNKAELDQFRGQGIEVRKYPIDKNETDLEIALEAAQKMEPSIIWIVAALGKRIDQTLANIFLLTRPKLASYDVRLVDGHQEVFLIRKSVTLLGKPGQRVSLLPINGPAKGIQTQGLAYSLQNETLYPDKTRGISNWMTNTSATISIENGFLLCVHETIKSKQNGD